ncbi:hypothetical protein ACJX0J_020930 [Zea mays]
MAQALINGQWIRDIKLPLTLTDQHTVQHLLTTCSPSIVKKCVCLGVCLCSVLLKRGSKAIQRDGVHRGPRTKYLKIEGKKVQTDIEDITSSAAPGTATNIIHPTVILLSFFLIEVFCLAAGPLMWCHYGSIALGTKEKYCAILQFLV